MSAEYTGKIDQDKTIFVLPRPMDDPHQRIRAQNLTSDPSGRLPTDNRQWWTGTDWAEAIRLEAIELQRRQINAGIDSSFY